MRYVAAYLLAALGGKDNPSSPDIEKILSSVGIEAEGEKLKKVISELNGKNIEELIVAGQAKLSTMPAGGGGAAPAAGGGTAAPAAAAAAAPEKEEKKVEKKVESDSEDDDMGFGLFD